MKRYMIAGLVSIGIAGTLFCQAQLGGGPDAQAGTQQARQLMTALQQANWNETRVDFNLMRLSDAQYAENEDFRPSDRGSFVIYTSDDPDYSEVAFYTPVYAKQNVHRDANGNWTTNPTGVYIVGYRNGNVAQVPAAQLKWIDQPDGTRAGVFPGQAAYPPSLSPLPVQLPNPISQ